MVSADGRVWTFGDGWNGRLGHNDEQQRLVPTLLAAEVFKGSKIVTVAAGGYYTMAVGVNGALWAWGRGSSGKLGLGDTNDRLMPTLVGAEEVFAPASNCVNPSLFAVSPTPSWPSSLRPQVHACPAAVTAIVCDARSRKHPLRHPRQPPPRLLVAEARESPPQM